MTIATEIIAAFTCALFIVGVFQALAYRKTLETSRVIERAYLGVTFQTAVYQDATHVFEARANLTNNGHTPAYNVAFKADIRVVPFPIPENFDFALPAHTTGTSSSFMTPGSSKFIARTLSYRVPDPRVEPIKHCEGECLLMWGIATYRDAFKSDRFVKFAFGVRWQETIDPATGAHLTPIITSLDAGAHNDAD